MGAPLPLPLPPADPPLVSFPLHTGFQLRDFNGFLKTREDILKARPNMRTSWVGAALANSLSGNYSKAFELVSKANETMKDEAQPPSAYESSEFLLFQNQCLEKQGKFAEALAHIKKIAPDVVDVLGLRVKEAELLLLSGQYEEAQAAWVKLTSEQSDNYRFHCGMQTAFLRLDAAKSREMLALRRLDLPCTRLALTAEQRGMLLSMYRSGGTVGSGSATGPSTGGGGGASLRCPKKIEMTLVGHGAEFRALIDAHMRKCCHSGMPALYHDVCSLVTQPDPHDPTVLVPVKDAADFRAHPATLVVTELLQGYISSLRATSKFPPSTSASASASPSEAPLEPPTTILWAMYLHAHLLERSGDLQLALSVIDECIAHTPTAPDMLLKKARILKQCGDPYAAAEVCDQGRALDLQDRYLNNKATKYYLRADRVEDAVNTISLFTKHEGDPQQYLSDMQCSWFELEAGESACRSKAWGLALKNFHSVKKHFEGQLSSCLFVS